MKKILNSFNLNLKKENTWKSKHFKYSLKNTIKTEIVDYLLNSFKDLDLLITSNNTIDLTLKKDSIHKKFRLC